MDKPGLILVMFHVDILHVFQMQSSNLRNLLHLNFPLPLQE